MNQPNPIHAVWNRGVLGRAVGGILLGFALLTGCDFSLSGESITYPLKTTNGDFLPAVTYPVGNFPLARVLADVNNDGIIDVVVLSQFETIGAGKPANVASPGTIQFLINDGAGGFTVVEGPSPGVRPSTLRTGNLNGDGWVDLVLLSDDAKTLTLLFNGGDAGWTMASHALGGTGADIKLADLNSDGSATDVLVALSQPDAALDPGLIMAFVNDGAGAMTRVDSNMAGASPENTPVQMLLGDWNLDGLPDLAVRDGGLESLVILIGLGDGRFAHNVPTIDTKKVPTDMISTDLNNDGIADLAITSTSHASVTLVLGNGAGGFTPLEGSPVKIFVNEKGPEQILAGNFSPAGPDLVVLHRGTKKISIMDNNGGGGFTHEPFKLGFDPFAVSAGDFNGDGITDLLTNERRDRTLAVLTGAGNATFERTVVAFSEPLSPALVADFDGNGMPDVLMLQPNTDSALVLLNCHPAVGAPCP